MDKFKSTALGGTPRTLNDLRWALGQESNQGIIQALNNILGANGGDFVVQGCVLSGVTPNVSMTEGWIMLSSELLKVNAATGINTATDFTFTKSTTFNTAGLKNLQSGATADTYEINRGALNGGAGTLNVLTGDRIKSEFDSWTSFDITGTNANLVSNPVSDGSGVDRELFAAADGASTFRYRIVGKTVYWNMQITGFRIHSFFTVGALYTMVIKNLPFTAFTKQSLPVRLESTNEGCVSHNTMLTMETSSDRMYVNMRWADISIPVSLNLQYEHDTAGLGGTNSMRIKPLVGGDTTSQMYYNMNGGGVFEIE